MRAALDGEIVYVTLPERPGAGRQTLQLWCGEELVVALTAELVGSGREGGEYPLRLKPIDPSHLPELESIAARTSVPPAAVPGPAPRRRRDQEEDRTLASAADDKTLASAADDKTLATGGPEDRTLSSGAGGPAASVGGFERGEDRTLASRADMPRRPLSAPAPEPAAEEENPVSSSESESEIVATTVFDPDQLLRAPQAKNDDESLTIPRSLGNPLPGRSAAPPLAAFNDEESQTLPGSTKGQGAGKAQASEALIDDRSASWNVRIAPKTKDPLCGRIIGGGKYILDSVIGEGAIGIVFKASHKDLGRTVAIKVLNPRYRDDPDLLQIFRTEARAASLLEHPHLARVYDYGQEPDGLVYIVMEFLSGYTLGSVLRARRKLTEARAVEIMVQACGALAAAHDREIVHRDVKPDNIVLVPAQDDEGQPMEIAKVCDFGIAALGSSAPLEEDHAAGTPEYMAPEQSTGGSITPAADVYACGVVLYEMLTGEVPFTSDQAFRILMKHRTEAPRPPATLTPGLNRALEAIVLRCLEKQPEKRYRSARELRAELRKVKAAEA